MKLIIDSGSTKSEFRFLNTENSETFILPGINPYYQTEAEIIELIKTGILPYSPHKNVETIHFYGAGCTFSEKKKIVENALRHSFPETQLFIYSDLLAACRAVFGEKRGVACILGTGSNSCLYDGKEIIRNVSPLGFILGDEGSGAVLGRKLVSDCLKNQLPQDLREKFFEKYQTSQEEIMENVYKKPFPNRYLASLTPFLQENIQEEAIARIVKNSFIEFFERNVEQYPVKDEKLGFAGSVAYHFQETLREIIRERGYELYSIIQKPMDGLIEYHKN